MVNPMQAGTGILIDWASFTVSNGGVLSFQGSTGDIALTAGTGVSISGLTITNAGVLSFQGSTGDIALTAGTGVSISGLTIDVLIDNTYIILSGSNLTVNLTENYNWTGAHSWTNGTTFSGNATFNSTSTGGGITIQNSSSAQVLLLDTSVNTSTELQAALISPTGTGNAAGLAFVVGASLSSYTYHGFIYLAADADTTLFSDSLAGDLLIGGNDTGNIRLGVGSASGLTTSAMVIDTANNVRLNLPTNGYIELYAPDHQSIYWYNGSYSSRIGVNYSSQNLFLDTNIDISTSPDGTIQTDTSLPSWRLDFGSNQDYLQVSREPAGGTAFSTLLTLSNSGNMTVAGHLAINGQSSLEYDDYAFNYTIGAGSSVAVGSNTGIIGGNGRVIIWCMLVSNSSSNSIQMGIYDETAGTYTIAQNRTSTANSASSAMYNGSNTHGTIGYGWLSLGYCTGLTPGHVYKMYIYNAGSGSVEIYSITAIGITE